jgi:fucose permease
MKRWTRHPYLALCGMSMVVAAAFSAIALRVTSHAWVIAALFTAQFFLWFYNGPVNAILANCVSSRLRARAFALSILLIHLFGDAISPYVLGWVSDGVGLDRAIQMVPIAMGVGAVVWLYGWRALPIPAQAAGERGSHGG